MRREARRYIRFHFDDGTFRAEEIPPGMTQQFAMNQAQVLAQLYQGEIVWVEIVEAIDGEIEQTS